MNNAGDYMRQSVVMTAWTLLIGGGLTLLLLLGPIFIWLGWNVLGFGEAIGLSDLSFGGVLLVWLFCWGGALFRTILLGIVFLVDPAWLHMSATLHWPQASWTNLLAVLLLLGAFLPSSSSSDD